jgi:Exocyst complex component SEC3 N-terminal PIP2 binding PH
MSTDLEKKLNQQLFKQEDEELLFCSLFVDGKEDREDEKQRIICLTMKKQKCKIIKVKTANFTSFSITKNWKMDEISSFGFGDVIRVLLTL